MRVAAGPPVSVCASVQAGVPEYHKKTITDIRF